MPKYVIERELPGLGLMSPNELAATAEHSNQVLVAMDEVMLWQHSYVTGDKMYCVYIAPDAEAVRKHASRGGFPADAVNEVATIIDPSSGEVA